MDPKHIYSQAATYTVTLKVAYQGDACPNEETKSISILNAPPVSITNPQNKFSLCPGDTLRLEVSGDIFSSYSWSTGAITPFIIVNEAIDYAVSVTNPSGCIIQATKTISAIEPQTVTAVAEPAEIKINEMSKLSATGLESYLWRPGTGLSDSTIANPVAMPFQNITYTVSGIDINGCKGEATVDIIVTGSTAIDRVKPKNFFSPNEDIFNPFWTIEEIESFPQCGVSVYNDKGAKIFEAKPYANNWDGTFKGSKVPGGVYYYVIRCDGDVKVKTGSITLLK
jgi:gliding motility-associated-like protein